MKEKMQTSMTEHAEVDAKTIDFKKLVQTHIERTEKSVPYTIQQVEDVMFIDEKHLVALESIFY